MAASSDFLRQPSLISASPLADALFSRGISRFVLAILAGWLASLGFAPSYSPLLSVVGVVLWLIIVASETKAVFALLLGLGFGCGLYIPSMWWLYAGVRSSEAPLLAYLAPTLLIMGMILQPVVLGGATFLMRKRNGYALLLLVPALSVLLEWIKYQGEMPFPWLNVGYLQIPSGPLVGFAALGGVLAVCWATWCCAGAVVLMLSGRQVRLSAWVLCVLLFISFLAHELEWTEVRSKDVSIALLQGNVRNEGKFTHLRARQILSQYEDLIAGVEADLVVLPETALPLFDKDIPPAFLEHIAAIAARNRGDVIVSHLAYDPALDGRYYTVARSVGVSGQQWYFKRKLVPFGEYIPYPILLESMYRQITKINLLHTSPGLDEQPTWLVAGQRVALRLCYEDLFGGDYLDEVGTAKFLVGLVNDDWFDSAEPSSQHLQVAQARAIEARKPFVRAANTGLTAALNHRGQVIQMLPPDVAASMVVTIAPREGLTPFVRFGNWPVLVIAALSLSVAFALLLSGRKSS